MERLRLRCGVEEEGRGEAEEGRREAERRLQVLERRLEELGTSSRSRERDQTDGEQDEQERPASRLLEQECSMLRSSLRDIALLVREEGGVLSPRTPGRRTLAPGRISTSLTPIRRSQSAEPPLASTVAVVQAVLASKAAAEQELHHKVSALEAAAELSSSSLATWETRTREAESGLLQVGSTTVTATPVPSPRLRAPWPAVPGRGERPWPERLG